ncbi:MAG: hypothetical protein PHE95_05910, partial [Candidatus Methanomethylophilus sp.]|nr:hypothetical protein [Methanomethylophilus sp.]
MRELQIYVSECGVSALFYKGHKAISMMTMEFYFGMNQYSFILVPADSGRLAFADEFVVTTEHAVRSLVPKRVMN